MRDNRNHLFSILVSKVCTVLLLSGISTGPVSAAELPHIVILVADDLGWADVSFHGGPIQTPNLDRLATEGATFSRFYVCPVCSPTRAGLMTGRYPIRYGLMRAVAQGWTGSGGSDSARGAGQIRLSTPRDLRQVASGALPHQVPSAAPRLH